MAFIIFPLNVLHGHETEEFPCHDDHFDLSVDSCHISIYHNASEIEHCDHKEHLVDRVEDCELCDFVASRTLDINFESTEYLISELATQSNFKLTSNAVKQQLKDNLQGRAPPTYQG